MINVIALSIEIYFALIVIIAIYIAVSKSLFKRRSLFDYLIKNLITYISLQLLGNGILTCGRLGK